MGIAKSRRSKLYKLLLLELWTVLFLRKLFKVAHLFWFSMPIKPQPKWNSSTGFVPAKQKVTAWKMIQNTVVLHATFTFAFANGIFGFQPKPWIKYFLSFTVVLVIAVLGTGYAMFKHSNEIKSTLKSVEYLTRGMELYYSFNALFLCFLQIGNFSL